MEFLAKNKKSTPKRVLFCYINFDICQNTVKRRDIIGIVTAESEVPSKTKFAALSCPSPIISSKLKITLATGQAVIM